MCEFYSKNNQISNRPDPKQIMKKHDCSEMPVFIAVHDGLFLAFWYVFFRKCISLDFIGFGADFAVKNGHFLAFFAFFRGFLMFFWEKWRR